MSENLEKIGLDIGTYNIICARMENEQLSLNKEINAFFSLNVENKFMVNMLEKNGAPIIKLDEKAIILGEAARDLAISMGQEFKRPMKNGILSINEKDAFNILAFIIHSIIGDIENDSIAYYSIPADAINTDTNASYHQKIIQNIMDKYNRNDKKIYAYPINEALCIVYSELQKENRTGIAISWGAGMVNVVHSILGVPTFEFSLTNSGDWIDEQAAKHCGETASYMNKIKEEIDLSKEPANSIERSIVYHYQILVDNAIKGIINGIEQVGSKANPGKPISIVLAGGTASPNGFVEFFNKSIEKSKFPLEVGDIKIAKDHLYAVSKGALLASQYHSD